MTEITSILDARISGVVNDTQRPDPLAPAERERLTALLRRRNDCPEEEIETVDREILEIVRPHALTPSRPCFGVASRGEKS